MTSIATSFPLGMFATAQVFYASSQIPQQWGASYPGGMNLSPPAAPPAKTPEQEKQEADERLMELTGLKKRKIILGGERP